MIDFNQEVYDALPNEDRKAVYLGSIFFSDISSILLTIEEYKFPKTIINLALCKEQKGNTLLHCAV